MSDLQIAGSGCQPQSAAPAGTAAWTKRTTASQEQEDSPTLLEQMQQAREEAEKTRDKFRLPKNGRRYGDAAIEAYARLARARNASQVSSAAGFARRQLFRLKAAKRQDPEHARQIQGAIGQLQKAVNRAGKKRSELAREELAEKRRKKLMQEEQLRRAKRLHQQLQSKRTMRLLRESGYIREAEVDQKLHAQMDAQQADMREQFQSVVGAAAGAQDAAITRCAAQAASLENPPADPTVTALA